jgi:hypothetical protein
MRAEHHDHLVRLSLHAHGLAPDRGSRISVLDVQPSRAERAGPQVIGQTAPNCLSRPKYSLLDTDNLGLIISQQLAGVDLRSHFASASRIAVK